MAGYDLSGVGRVSRTTNEYYVILDHEQIVEFFNQFRTWLNPDPPGQSYQSPITISIRKENGSTRRIGEISSTETLIFSFPISIIDDNSAIAISEPLSPP